MAMIPGYPRRVGTMVEVSPGRFRDYRLHMEAARDKYRRMGLRTSQEILEHIRKEYEDAGKAVPETGVEHGDGRVDPRGRGSARPHEGNHDE